MTDDLPTPCHPLHLLALSHSSTLSSLVGTRLSVLFSESSRRFHWHIFVFNTPEYVFFISPHHMSVPGQTGFSTWSFWKPVTLSLSFACVRYWSCICVSLRTSTLASASRFPQSVSLELWWWPGCPPGFLVFFYCLQIVYICGASSLRESKLAFMNFRAVLQWAVTSKSLVPGRIFCSVSQWTSLRPTTKF